MKHDVMNPSKSPMIPLYIYIVGTRTQDARKDLGSIFIRRTSDFGTRKQETCHKMITKKM